ncbi:MAG: TonB-dependent receptor, partial [Calditrichota bacterium]
EGKLHFRGGRSGNVAFIQEGVDLRDPLVDTQLNLNLSAQSIDEISVISGGFSAEYGRAMGAIVQITTSEGKRDKYSGRFQYQTDRVIETYSFNSDRVEAALGGPVPYTKNWKNPVTFYVSTIGSLTNTYTPFDINRPANDYLGLGVKLPERQNNDYQGSLKLAYNLTGSKKLTLYLNSSYSQWDIFPLGEGGYSGNNGYPYKYNLENRPWAWNRKFSGTLTFTNNISSETYYEIKLITYRTRTKVQPRGKSPGEFTLQDDIENTFALAGDRNGNGKLDKDEYMDTDGDGFMDGFWDANDNNIFDGGGEGYEDLNMNGRWDRGEDWVDLNGNGIYDAAEPWTDVVNPLTGENTLGVFDPWDSYTDLNGNGRWDPAEPQLAEHDWNKNGVWDGERFLDADNDGKYDPWEPWEDLNGNFLWDPGEPFTDVNGNGKYDYSEGYDDKNKNGRIDKRDLAARGQSTPFVDTGEPFIDEPDPITGEFNGRWNSGEIWFDLPSSSNSQTGAGLYYMGTDPVLNGRYDGPNYRVDEYELFCQPANWSFSSDRSRPVIYMFNEEKRGMDWPEQLLAYIPGKSTWINRTLHDSQNPEFNIHNFNVEEDKEWFLDYNKNGQWDPADGFLNPDMWDPTAFWQDRVSTEYTLKFDIASQATKHHQLKSGCEIKFRDLQMQSIKRPDLDYTGEAALPSGSPWPDRGGIRDFYKYQPWEGALYVEDKMEFEGLIVQAGLRDDFIIHDPNAVNEFRERVENDEPGAIYANRGTQRISPRLGVSHPITEKSKLYFNYAHFYQAPSFEYFYKSSTANFDANTTIGNPNLEYMKTIQYELGVNTQISDYVILNIAGYYRDEYDMVSTQDERWKNLTLDRYVNIDYGRTRGFEFTIDKRPANHYALTFNYDFSFAYGKASEQHAAQDARLKGVPYNYDEHPLNWDETHKINAYLTILYDKKDYPRLLGMTLPDDWSMTLQWEFGSGVPYSPSKYTTGISNANLILPNSARYPWHENTTLKFEKYYTLNPQTGSRFFFGFEVNNLFNKRNIVGLYGETGSPTKAVHPLNPAYVPNNNRQEYDANPLNFSSPRNIKFMAGLTI